MQADLSLDFGFKPVAVLLIVLIALASAAIGAGPADSSEGRPATGFAHTPEGALIAALHCTGRLNGSFPLETRLAVIDDQMVDGPEREAFRAFVLAEAEPHEPIGNQPAIVQGYLIHSYTQARTVVEIAIGQEELVASFILTLEWDRDADDWRLRPPANGEAWTYEFRQIHHPDAFTPWGP